MEESDGFNLMEENDSLIAASADDDSSSTLTHLPSHSSGIVGENGVDGMDRSNGNGEQLPQLFENGVEGMDRSNGNGEQLPQLFENGVEGTCRGNGNGEQLPQLFETSEPKTLKKTGKYNLRKSLAWDSAFFESPGFLDAEDISTMIDGAERGKQHLLPGIDEDISRSTESISTLLSENLTLESLEAELFVDIRASIQKSSKASGIATSNRKAAQKETDKPVKSIVKKVDVTSRNRIATKTTSTMQTGGMQGSGRILKKDSSFPLATQPVLRNGNSTSSLFQSPKVITKPGTMSKITTKRDSIDVNHTRIEPNTSKVGVKGIQVSKAAGLAGPRRSVPKPASFSEASCSVSSGASVKEVGRSSSSSSKGCNSISTKKVHNLPSTSVRTKMESKPVIKAPSSIPKASSKIPLRKKPSGKSNPPSSLMSSKISSSISPSSSISEWSSASSSTSNANQRLKSRTSIDTNTLCSTVNQRFTGRTSIDTKSSRRSMDRDTPSILSSDVQSNDDIPDGNMNQFKEFPNQDAKKISVQSSVLSRSTLIKPSGLRMPSPKIGFFDGAKAVVRTPNGCRQSQPRLPTGLPKIGAAVRSPVGSLKKAEEKIQPGKTTASADADLDTSKSASPKLSQEPSRGSMKVLGAHRSVLSPNIPSEVRSSDKATGKQRPEITLTSTNLELEGQNPASPISFPESVPGVSPDGPDVHNEMDGSNCLKTEDVEIGKPDSAKHATANAPKANNDENLLLII